MHIGCAISVDHQQHPPPPGELLFTTTHQKFHSFITLDHIHTHLGYLKIYLPTNAHIMRYKRRPPQTPTHQHTSNLPPPPCDLLVYYHPPNFSFLLKFFDYINWFSYILIIYNNMIHQFNAQKVCVARRATTSSVHATLSIVLYHTQRWTRNIKL